MSEQKSQKVITAIKLKYPIEWGEDGPVNVVQFVRRPQARDLKGLNLQNLSIEDQCKILANITDADAAQLLRCDMYDMQRLSEVLNDFLSGGQGTGEKP